MLQGDGGKRFPDDLLCHGDVLLQDFHDRLDAHRLGCFVPAIVIGHKGEDAVAHLSLARQLGLRQVRHADHIHPPLAVDTRLGFGGELGAFDTQVGATEVYARAGPPGCRMQNLAQQAADRIGKADMRHNAPLEKCAGAGDGAIDELIRNHHLSGYELFPHASHGTDGNEPLDPQALQGKDIRAGVDVGGHDAMAAPMAGDKGYLDPVPASDHHGI